MVPLRTSYCWWSTGPVLLLPLSHMSSSIPYHFAQWRFLESHLTEIPCLVICISYSCFPLKFFCFVFVYGYWQVWLWFLRCIWLLSIDDKWWKLWCFSSLITESWNVPSSNPFVTPASSFLLHIWFWYVLYTQYIHVWFWDLLNLMLRHMQDRLSPYIITFDWQEVQILLICTDYTEIISLLLLWMLKCISDPIRKQFFL